MTRRNFQTLRDILKTVDNFKIYLTETLLSNREFSTWNRDFSRSRQYHLSKPRFPVGFDPSIPPPSTFHYITLNNDINLDNVHFDPDTSGDLLPTAMRNIALAKIQDINLDSDDSSKPETPISPPTTCFPRGKWGSAGEPCHPPLREFQPALIKPIRSLLLEDHYDSPLEAPSSCSSATNNCGVLVL